MDNLIISSRGQITLPAKLRKRLGIEPGGVLIAEEQDGALLLRPAAVIATRLYSDEEIARWAKQDEPTPEFEAKLAAWMKREQGRRPSGPKSAKRKAA